MGEYEYLLPQLDALTDVNPGMDIEAAANVEPTISADSEQALDAVASGKCGPAVEDCPSAYSEAAEA
jgi:hypothetical protein